MPFLKRPLLAPSGSSKGRVVYSLLENVTYRSKEFGDIKIPKGFKTDLASVPKMFSKFVAPDAHWIKDAAIVHDFARSKYMNMDPDKAAKLFGNVLKEHGNAPAKANILEGVVRSLGQFFENPKLNP